MKSQKLRQDAQDQCKINPNQIPALKQGGEHKVLAQARDLLAVDSCCAMESC